MFTSSLSLFLIFIDCISQINSFISLYIRSSLYLHLLRIFSILYSFSSSINSENYKKDIKLLFVLH